MKWLQEEEISIPAPEAAGYWEVFDFMLFFFFFFFFKYKRSMNSNSSKMVLWGHEPTIFSICWLAKSSCYSCPNNSSLDLLAHLAVSSTSLDSVTVLYARCRWWHPVGDLGSLDLTAANCDTYRSLGAEPRQQMTKHRDCHRREDSLELKAVRCRPEAPLCGTSETPWLWGFRGIGYRASLSSTPAFEFNWRR